MCFRTRNRTGRRTAVRNQQSCGLLVSPREIPVGSTGEALLPDAVWADVRELLHRRPPPAADTGSRSRAAGRRSGGPPQGTPSDAGYPRPVQGGAPQCATNSPADCWLARGRFPSGQREKPFYRMRFGPTYGNCCTGDRRLRRIQGAGAGLRVAEAAARPKGRRLMRGTRARYRAAWEIPVGSKFTPPVSAGGFFFYPHRRTSPGRPVGRPYIHPGNQHPRATPRRGQGTRPTDTREFTSACRVGS